MNPRVTTLVVGSVITLLGAAGLLYPERVLGLVGFGAPAASRVAAAYGEVRATYGGLFLVMGVATLLAGLDPPRHRARLVLVGLLWLGAGGGRLFGVYVDGNPGLPAWLALVFEAVIGGALLLAAQSARPLGEGAEAAVRHGELT
jgi:hypothetical protein